MENKSKLNIKYITTADGRHMGGWTSYCNFYEIKDNDNNIVAQVNEEDGTVVLPFNNENKIFIRSYRNRAIPVTLLEVYNDFIIIEIHNLYNTKKKLWYRR